MKKLLSIVFAVLILVSCGEEKKPLNVLFIISDDLTTTSISSYNEEGVSKTPSIDKLASEGLQFNRAYCQYPVCGPSRAGLLTGKYQQRFGYEENNVPGIMSASGLQGDDMGLPLDQQTMGDYLKGHGYQTAYFGKCWCES